MPRTLLLGITAAILVSVCGCGGRPGPEHVINEQLGAMKDAATILEGVKDEASAEAALPKLEKVAERVAASNKLGEDLKLSDEQRKQLAAKHQAEAKETSNRVFGLLMHAQSVAPRKAQQFRDLMPKLGFEAKTFSTVGQPAPPAKKMEAQGANDELGLDPSLPTDYKVEGLDPESIPGPGPKKKREKP